MVSVINRIKLDIKALAKMTLFVAVCYMLAGVLVGVLGTAYVLLSSNLFGEEPVITASMEWLLILIGDVAIVFGFWKVAPFVKRSQLLHLSLAAAILCLPAALSILLYDDTVNGFLTNSAAIWGAMLIGFFLRKIR